MKHIRRNRVAFVLSLAILFIGLVILFVFKNSGRIITLIATLTTVIGVFSIYVQMRKAKLVGESSFTLEISKYLYEFPDLPAFIHKLGRASDIEDTEYVVSVNERTILIKYLNYIKTIAALVKEKTVEIETLNKVFAYEFFIIVNNPSVQDMEFKIFPQYYEDIFLLYYQWTHYLLSHDIEILHDEHALSNLPQYKEYIRRILQ